MRSTFRAFTFRQSRHSELQIRLLTAFVVATMSIAAVAQTSSYSQTNIVSDGAVPAMQTDATLINPWGVSIGPQFWIDSPGSGFSLVDDSQGNKAFAVAIPPASSSSPHGSPAGTIYNSDQTLFLITGGAAQFLFGTLDGTIAAWNTSTPQAVTMVNNSAEGAVYTGLAVDKTSNGSFLLAANFKAGTVDVFSSTFAAAQLSGSFSDSTIPDGFSPFGIHAINGNIYVTYAQVNAQGREAVGAGLGYVDVFDPDGTLLQSAISQGNLNAPWGMALAPSGFGSLSGDLLVGNFGDGVINAYDPATYAFKGQVQDASGKPIANTGLWEIVFGTSGVGDPNTLYFTAGINQEKDGLFGSIALATPTGGSASFAIASSETALTVTATQPGTASLKLTPQNNFSGSITLSCSGLPADTSCSFSPMSVNLSGSGAQTVNVSIAETIPASGTNPYETGSLPLAGSYAAFAFAAPVGLLALAGFRRRSLAIRGLMAFAFVAGLTVIVSGCGSSNSAAAAPTGTPSTVKVMVNATSGSLTQSIPITVTLQ